MPTMPHIDAGLRTEPPVSVPKAAGMNPAATATPEPLDEQYHQACRNSDGEDEQQTAQEIAEQHLRVEIELAHCPQNGGARDR